MTDLIAQGEKKLQRWRRRLPDGQTVVLGRGCGEFSADWDDRISRRHAELCWQRGRLKVSQLPSARNPIFADGTEKTHFEVRPGEQFVIGQTRFVVTDDKIHVSLDLPQPAHEQAFSADFLQQLQFRNSRARIDVLARLPEVISGATSDRELFVRLVNLLLSGIAGADAAALVQVAPSSSGENEVEVLHWDRHATAESDFAPSERLIRKAIERRESVLHIWSAGSESAFTAGENVDWAFCTPVLGEACRGWALYVAGRSGGSEQGDTPTGEADHQDDLKFTEVAAQTLQSIRQVRQLQNRQASLRQFFSPVVMAAVASEDPDVVLAPREADVSVLFCDLRGFARESERSSDLLELLNRVSRALGVTTRHILERGGVVGDFQGDAVMGFWGWPLAGDEDTSEAACRATLEIRAELQRAARQKDDLLSGFRMGIGIATGRAVAGKIGTVDQVKVTVFGPVVNLASRLESMTKVLCVPILLDETTADHVAASCPPTLARRRRLARVRPAGLETPLTVSELLPPSNTGAPSKGNRSHFSKTTPEPLFYIPSDADVERYEAALDAFLAGRWDDAFDRLHQLPTEDRAKDFLTGFIAQHNRLPPANWDGVITFDSK